MKKLLYRKIIPLLLIVSILAPAGFLSLPNKVSAVVPVVAPDTDLMLGTVDASIIAQTAVIEANWAVEQAEKLAEKAWDWAQRLLTIAARLFVRALIMQITQSIVNWINSGFEGSPSFMTNPAGILRNAADQAVGQYILEGPLNFLCEPFQLQVKLNLGLQYSTYNNGISCTLSGVLGNIQGAYDDFVGGDFIGGGGWDSWMQMASRPENTPQGAAMLAESALSVKLAGIEKIDLLEANWGSGSLSLKKCKEATYEVSSDPSAVGGTRRTLTGARTFVGHPGYATGTSVTATHENVQNEYGGNTIVNQEKERTCETTTPGAMIMDTMKVSSNSWIKTMELESVMSDSINAIIGAFATLAVKVTLSKVMGGLFGGEEDNTDYRAQMMQKLEEAKNDPSNNYYKNDLYYNSGTSTTNQESEISLMISSEQTNLENYVLASTTLSLAKTEFLKAVVCNISNHRDLKSNLIKANVVDNIDGISQNNSYRTVSVVSFNIPYITNMAAKTSENIYKLRNIENEAKTGTASSSEASKIIASSTPTTNLQKEITDWLNGSRSSYSDTVCPINTVW